jgi:hypothetical protein
MKVKTGSACALEKKKERKKERQKVGVVLEVIIIH